MVAVAVAVITVAVITVAVVAVVRGNKTIVIMLSDMVM